MDYTTLEKVKASMDSQESVQDLILADFITRASRYIDRLCTSEVDVVDYFKAETITDEILTNGVINSWGDLAVFPHKPITSSVSAFAYRMSLKAPWITGNTSWISCQKSIVVYEGQLDYTDRIYVKLTYTGGLGADVASLPADLVDLATLMTIRLYKEARSGLGDTIGVAELGTMVYTKAFPTRFLQTLNVGNFMRTAPWI